MMQPSRKQITHATLKPAGKPPRLAPAIALVGLFGGALPLAYLAYQAAGKPHILGIVLAANLAYAACFTCFMLINAQRALKPSRPALRCSGIPDITVAIAAHNEHAVILDCLNSLLRQTVTVDEIIIVDDGSDDGMADLLTLWLKLEPDTSRNRLQKDAGPQVAYYRSTRHPQVRLIRQSRAGKARALNFALQAATGTLFITCDADCMLQETAVETLARAMAEDPEVAAAGGIVKPGNGVASGAADQMISDLPDQLLVRLQWVEYATGFVWRFAWSNLQCQLLLSGSFSAFRTASLQACGGFDETSLTEDYEISYRLHRLFLSLNEPYRLITVPNAVALTLVPETLTSFLQQRIRWFQGFVETLWTYRRCVLRPRYGWFGVFGLTIKCIDAVSPLLALASIVTIAGTLIAGGAAWIAPVLALVAARWVFEFAISLILLKIHHARVQADTPLAQRRRLYILGPVNFMFQSLCWYVYGCGAYLNILSGRGPWRKTARTGFARRDPQSPS